MRSAYRGVMDPMDRYSCYSEGDTEVLVKIQDFGYAFQVELRNVVVEGGDHLFLEEFDVLEILE